MSRKFTDGEIRAYSKNRYEEKVLRSKLEKLKEDIGSFHDSTAKQRQSLVEECKVIRMTTGGSPVPVDVIYEGDFDISKRVQRPWAYSVMEITHNAAYRDAVIPLPKQKRRRPKSVSTTRAYTSHSSLSVFDDKSRRGSTLSPPKGPSRLVSMASLSDSAIQGLDRSSSSPKMALDVPVNSSDIIHKPRSASNAPRDKFGFSEKADKSKSIPDIVIDKTEQSHQGHIVNEAEQSDVFLTLYNESMDTADEQDYIDKSNLFSARVDEDKLMRSIGAPVFLPPVYKIDSKAYQDAERARTVNRSKSRVSFSSSIAAMPDRTSHSAGKERTKSSSPDASGNSKMDRSNIKCSSVNASQPDQDNDFPDNTMGERSNTILTLDPEAFHDVRVRKVDDVLFKGRRLKNYIHPEDRYKLDPLVMKRRQNKMDRLTKESVSFLKRVNHENINVEIAFPRSARKRILLKLVEENNSGKSKTICDDDGVRIQKKVEYFMSSISDYVKQQQYEREQTYT